MYYLLRAGESEMIWRIYPLQHLLCMFISALQLKVLVQAFVDFKHISAYITDRMCGCEQT